MGSECDNVFRKILIMEIRVHTVYSAMCSIVIVKLDNETVYVTTDDGGNDYD